MKICLIRHGETDWNKAGRLQGREDIPLNAEGIRQACAVARCLRGGAWRAVIAGPLLRARQTAQIVADTLGIAQVTTDPRFTERDYGAASGLTQEQRERRFPDGRYAGMEDWETMRARVYGGLLDCARKHRGEDILIVSHGGAINAILSTLTDGQIGSGKTRLQNACMTMLSEDGGVLTLDYYNRSADEMDCP